MKHRKHKKKKGQIFKVLVIAALFCTVAIGIFFVRKKNNPKVTEVIKIDTGEMESNNTVEVLEIEKVASSGEKEDVVGLSESVWGNRKTEENTVTPTSSDTEVTITESTDHTDNKQEISDTTGTTFSDTITVVPSVIPEVSTDPVIEQEVIAEVDAQQNDTTDGNAILPEDQRIQESNIVTLGDESERYGLMDAMMLNPVMPQNEQLRAILDERMPAIIGGCTTNGQKVKAIYNYLIDNFRYSTTVKYDYEKDAVVFLTEYKGSCTYYSAAMHYMLLYIGIDNRIVDGYRYPDPTSSRTSFHRWIEINVNGISYVFDPQWEDTLSGRHGGTQYERFFKTHDEVKKFYVF